LVIPSSFVIGHLESDHSGAAGAAVRVFGNSGSREMIANADARPPCMTWSGCGLLIAICHLLNLLCSAAVNITLMITCLADCFRPAAGKAVVGVLRRLGHTIHFPEDQTCCGQPMYNSGYANLAREQARHTIRVFEQSEGPIVCPSGSCAAMVKVEYPHLLADEPEWHARAERLAARTHEFSSFLVNELGLLDVGATFAGRVAYHEACHLRMLKATNEVEQLIRHVRGAEYVSAARQDQCCGFGGSFAVRYGEISASLVNDKANCILATGADVVVSTDAGCLMNIGGRLHRRGEPIEVLHIAELLDRQT
jgi:L-lactate dehydrogenase complex protein LldE